ncbi:hypothetical protein LXL04_008121 [Taraxacum kok-saghyz]
MYVVLVMERKTETVARAEMKKHREWSVSDDIRATSGRRRKMSIEVFKGMEEAVAVRDGDLRIHRRFPFHWLHPRDLDSSPPSLFFPPNRRRSTVTTHRRRCPTSGSTRWPPGISTSNIFVSAKQEEIANLQHTHRLQAHHYLLTLQPQIEPPPITISSCYGLMDGTSVEPLALFVGGSTTN